MLKSEQQIADRILWWIGYIDGYEGYSKDFYFDGSIFYYVGYAEGREDFWDSVLEDIYDDDLEFYQ